MATFHYRAIDKKGTEAVGLVDAENLALAINQIQSMGYFPTKVGEATRSQKQKDKSKRPKSGFYIGGTKTKEVCQFTRQLATLIDAGLPLLRSLHVLGGQLKPCKLKDSILEIADDVQAGATLSEAMSKHKKVFTKLYINMIRAGEIGGILEIVLTRLAEFMERAEALKRQVKGAMIYPIAVLTVAGSVIALIMIKVVPTFKEVFAEFETGMPWLTTELIDAGMWMSAGGGWWKIIIVLVGTVVTLKTVARIDHFRRFFDPVGLKLPLVGSLWTKVCVARFARTLGTLVTSGVPILQSLKIVRDVVGNHAVSRAVDKIHDSVREGDTIASPLQESNVFPMMVTNMIDVGEETGALDQMLMKVADIYDDEVEVAVKAMIQLMEPIMIVVLGAIVGTIVIALYLPLFSLVDSLSGTT